MAVGEEVSKDEVDDVLAAFDEGAHPPAQANPGLVATCILL